MNRQNRPPNQGQQKKSVADFGVYFCGFSDVIHRKLTTKSKGIQIGLQNGGCKVTTASNVTIQVTMLDSLFIGIYLYYCHYVTM